MFYYFCTNIKKRLNALHLLGLAISYVINFMWSTRKVWKLVPECISRTGYKELWNLLTQLSSMVRNGSSSRTQLLPTRPRRLRSGCGRTSRYLSAPRPGPRGVQTSTPWTINCELFRGTRLAESITTTQTVWRDPLWKQRQRSPFRRCVPR
jgi:hypothetical protein